MITVLIQIKIMKIIKIILSISAIVLLAGCAARKPPIHVVKQVVIVGTPVVTQLPDTVSTNTVNQSAVTNTISNE